MNAKSVQPRDGAAQGTDRHTNHTHVQQDIPALTTEYQGRTKNPTHVTLKRLLSCVRPLVLIEAPLLAEGLAAL